ncbi:DUF760 domain-containing protein [Leptolyngbya sp. NK1-12]|uniref:DUF760 domain-containing protein n=1 Tax=Leptolyngbya sp. NK1-12 TaxID=2547451 RepID=A0AA96WH75_9CYAN|nr:DUF760 domain-containing protein [Leptolyngbya sp. NK1-12]WNZ26002.1 DUF760 domain-containing protein [Leptolyngbya sp. NK1-12]
MNNSTNQILPMPSNGNSLLDYIQTLPPETVSQLSTPDPEARQMMEYQLAGLLETLPPQHFGITITMNRQHLGHLLASAMMSGYFLRNAQQRLLLEQALPAGEVP